jgi:hypothetical protein
MNFNKNHMKRVLSLFSIGALLLSAVAVQAEDAWLKPYSMVSNAPGDVKTKAAEVSKALIAGGFEIVGSYSPYDSAVVMGATSNALKAIAAKSKFGGYGSVVRVSVTKVGENVQVAYFNPAWMAAAYRMDGDLAEIKAALVKALGANATEFGAEAPGYRESQLRDYHFMIFMPYFDDHMELASYASQEEAIKAVEAGLAAGKGGTNKVYRVDIPGKKESMFGVSMIGKPAGDEHIMGIIDHKESKQTAHLPYELLVSDGKVYALHAKFRIAVNFPDLTMNTFMHINDAPDAIEVALRAAAGGK